MIINKELANKKVASAYGEIEFNENGESTNLAEAHQKHLGEFVRGFTYVPDAANPEKKQDEIRKDEIMQLEDAATDGKVEALTAGEDKAKAMIPNDDDKAAAMDEDPIDKENAEEKPKPKQQRASRARKAK